jgi:hypothetical protein
VLQMMHDDLVMRGFFQTMWGPMPLYAWLTVAILCTWATVLIRSVADCFGSK